MVRVGFDLDTVIEQCLPVLPPGSGDGYDLRSLPVALVATMTSRYGRFLRLERQRYPRHFIRFGGSFQDYLAGFSAKTRSTLQRKRRRWIEAAGGMELREYHRPEDAEAFHRLAGALSARTYQSRLLDAGLPTGPAALAEFRRRAEAGAVRAYILFHQGEPASYLHLPVDNGCVVYAHLGYEPVFAPLSAGTVLQLEALERLFAEPALRLFDFTEGDGAHKRLFANGQVDCVDLLLLEPSWRNRLLAGALGGFDRMIERGSMLATRHGLKPAVRRWLRRSSAA
jgi:CelD/BcsL family acetyltransferase involved in cellulose biosynthesis